MLILFGGGDGGGFWIGPDGKLHRIPPYDPGLTAELKAANYLLKASTRITDEKRGREVLSIAEALTTSAVPHIGKAAGGAAQGSSSVAFLDGDDGFVCGSTGKHPIPVPVPHGPGFSPREN